MQQSPKRVRGKQLTQDIILERFKNVHGDMYDYSKVIFKTNNDPVIIICKRHGEYLCPPKRHTAGAKCRKCYLEDINGKFMQQEKWRKWASKQMTNNQSKLVDGMIRKYGVKNASNSEEIRNKKKQTFISRYGIENPYQLNIDERIAKMKNTKIQKGLIISDELQKPFILYKKKVWKYTNESIVYYDAYWLLENRSLLGNHIDHIYSIYEGFVNNIDPKIIGSIINLQTLSSTQNRAKGTFSWISKQELFEKYADLNKPE